MSLDRHAAERRRFARLLGIDGELGSGLPIGSGSSRLSGPSRDDSCDRPRNRERARECEPDSDERR
ncbi:hypothetical protein [Natrarchaeobius oligotrophus]|uniref:Uncharacterized protein n=1 Tax=Natrarchaeobius chitinivorans TaxID=1679083 RepID=A0A3N6PJN9_NATCH|nr:hypothetical protein [Natrarchaeobius chitinivorans]RQG98815.1 hypothetical protein EA472_16500 [Natrarchaeobius chitinivorans]